MTVRQAWFTLLPIMCMRKMPCFLSMSCLNPHPTCNATELRGKAHIDHNSPNDVALLRWSATNRSLVLMSDACHVARTNAKVQYHFG